MYEKQILDLVKKASPRNPLAYVNNIVKQYAADNLRQVMLACREVEYDTFRSTFDGDVHADIMIISDVPRSEHEESLRETEEKEMIEKVFDALGYDPSRLFYIDAINLLPVREVAGQQMIRLPNQLESKSSKVFVDHAIDIVRPKAILLLGPVASGMYLDVSFTEAKHKWMNAKGVPAIATFHPEKLLDREGKLHEDDLADMKELFITDIETLIKSTN